MPTPARRAAVSGLALGLGLIVAIGAQNAFVLRQGLRLELVAAVVAVCTASDLVLIAAGVLIPVQPVTYELADGPKALAELESRATVGKLALLP